MRPKLNPKFTLKELSKKSREVLKNEGKPRIKKAENRESFSAPAQTWHDRATQQGLAVPLLWPAGRAGSWVHSPCALLPARVLTCFARVVRCFASLDPRGFLEPPIFLEIAREVFFSIKI